MLKLLDFLCCICKDSFIQQIFLSCNYFGSRPLGLHQPTKQTKSLTLCSLRSSTRKEKTKQNKLNVHRIFVHYGGILSEDGNRGAIILNRTITASCIEKVIFEQTKKSNLQEKVLVRLQPV